MVHVSCLRDMYFFLININNLCVALIFEHLCFLTDSLVSHLVTVSSEQSHKISLNDFQVSLPFINVASKCSFDGIEQSHVVIKVKRCY